ELDAAIQPHQMFKFGANLLYYRIVEDLSKQHNFISSTGTARHGLSDDRFSCGLSTEVHAPEGIPLTLGIAYRHQAPLTLDGHAHFDNVPPPFASSLQDQAASEKLTVPNDFYVGLAYDVLPNLKLMGSWNLE